MYIRKITDSIYSKELEELKKVESSYEKYLPFFVNNGDKLEGKEALKGKITYLEALEKESSKVSLAVINLEDAEKYYEWHKDKFKNVDEASSHLEKLMEEDYFAIVDDKDNFLGIIGIEDFIPIDMNANLVIDFNHSNIDNNSINMLSTAVYLYLKYCKNYLNLKNISCSVPTSDKNKISILQNAGMHIYGIEEKSFNAKDNKFYDIVMFESLNNDLDKVNDEIMLTQRIINSLIGEVPLNPKFDIDYEPFEIDLENFPLSGVLPKINCDEKLSLIGSPYYPLKESDLDSVTRSFNNLKIATSLGISKENWSHSKVAEFLSEASYIIVKDNRAIGFIGTYSLSKNDRSCTIELGITDELEQGKGYGKKALTSFTEELFNKGILNVRANVFGFNERSLSLFRGTGYKEIGKRSKSYYADGKFHDTHILVKKNPIISN